MKRFLSGVAILLATVVALAAIQTAPQSNTGVIEGRVMRPDLSEGIPSVQITLVGPSPVLTAAELSSVYTPSPLLTPEMRQQIDALIASAPPGITPEVVAAAAARMQAQLLGQPAPATALAGGAAAQPPQAGATTDARGHFSFQNLAPGRYQIRAMRDGYFATPPPGTLGVGAPTTMNSNTTVVAGQPTPEVVMTMLRGGTVSGRVRDPGGQPASGLQIGAYQLTYQNSRAVLQQVNSKTTDDRGEYRLFWLPPGEYYIGVTPQRPRPAPGPQDAYARTFFPGAVDGRDAQTVTVGEGTEVAAVDLGIRAGGTTISGRVVNPFVGPNGQPTPASSFYLLPVDPKALTESGTINLPNTAANRNDGQFEIRGVLPGVYDLMTNAQNSVGQTVWGRTRINVGSGGAQDITLKIQQGIEVKARVTVDGAPPAFTMAAPPATRGGAIISSVGGVITTAPPPPPPLPGAAPAATPATVPTPTIRINWRSMEPYNAPFEGTASQTSTFDPSGVYNFTNVPEGRYFLQATGLPLNAYVADVLVGGMSVYDSGFDTGSVSSTIEVKVNSKGAKVQGSVQDGTKKPFASARVALVPQQARRQNINLYKTALSDAMGNFSFIAVAPGEYKLFAWEAVLNSAWMNAEFIAKYEDKGQSVTVGSADPAKFELRLIPR